jgi:competence protein ComEC
MPLKAVIVDKLTAPFFSHLPQEMAAVLAALIWGQKQYLSSDQYELFQKTGLLHILVLSGQNITLLITFFTAIFSFLTKKIQLIIGIAIALFYLLVFGSDPPIVRASIMSVLSTLCIVFQAQTLPIFLLILTAFLMLAFSPQLITSVSFWLSISATAGLITLYPKLLITAQRIKLFNKLPAEITSTFCSSLAAQIFTTPVLLLVFREISLISLPMNALLGWMVEPLMFIGVLFSLTGQVLPLIPEILAFILFGLLKLFLFFVTVGYNIGSNLVIRI